jgi:chromosome partitioning protein
VAKKAKRKQNTPRMPRKRPLKPITVAFSHLKGGVGKTTAAINVSNCFARMGYKTLLVDMDPQSSSSEMFLDQNQPEKTLYHVLYEEVPLAEVTQNISDNLYLAPPSIGVLTSNALIASSHLIIPVQVSYFALKGIENIMQTYQTIRQRANPKLSLLGVLINMIDDRLTFARDIKGDVSDLFGDIMFKTVIHRSVRLEESPAYRKNIFDHAPRSRGSEEFIQLTQEIIERCRNSSPTHS